MRGLSQPTTCAEYKIGNVRDNEQDVASTEDEYGFSRNDATNNPSPEDEIPKYIDTTNVDDDCIPSFNL